MTLRFEAFEVINMTGITDLTPLNSLEAGSPTPIPSILTQESTPSVPLALRILESLFLAALVVLGTIALVLTKTDSLSPRLSQIFLLSGSITLGVFLFFKLINQQLETRIDRQREDSVLEYRATLWAVDVPELQRIAIVAAREKALAYSQELIEDYKKTRSVARNLYYSLQLATILFSGITPILVLLDKLQTADSWARWLPVIFPAIASIVASIVTSFPFQETWISANATVELLEAEQEKFVLGVTQPYAYPLGQTGDSLQQKANQAIDGFINTINGIHLKRVQESSNAQRNQENE